MPAQPEGIHVENVTEWFTAHVPEIATPLTFTLIAGGRSNLTFRVEDTAGRAWVLRRPPIHHVLPTAHDMVREHRLMTSLGPSGIPVPKTIGLCTDEAVNERPFFVMEFVEGHILRDAAEAEKALDEATRRSVGGHMATTLAALHDVDPDAVGLGDLGRHEGYIERQLKRWRGQYEQMQVEGVDHGGLVERSKLAGYNRFSLYSLTEAGQALGPIYDTLNQWTDQYVLGKAPQTRSAAPRTAPANIAPTAQEAVSRHQAAAARSAAFALPFSHPDTPQPTPVLYSPPRRTR